VYIYIYIYIYMYVYIQRENAVAQLLVVVHVSVVMKPTDAQLYYFESLIVFCV
jgi:hypothetical protein